jgi:undecaprenyl pyrophosphate synthase
VFDCLLSSPDFQCIASDFASSSNEMGTKRITTHHKSGKRLDRITKVVYNLNVHCIMSYLYCYGFIVGKDHVT